MKEFHTENHFFNNDKNMIYFTAQVIHKYQIDKITKQGQIKEYCDIRIIPLAKVIHMG